MGGAGGTDGNVSVVGAGQEGADEHTGDVCCDLGVVADHGRG